MTDDDDQEQENIKGWLQGTTTLSLRARGEATAVAATIIGLSSDTPLVLKQYAGNLSPDRLAALESLTNQTEGRKTDTLKVIIGDPDSTCEQFNYDKGCLTEVQAKTMLVQIVSRREIDEQHERDLEKIQLESSLGFVGRLFSKLFGAS